MSSYHYSFYSPTDCTAWVFSHRFHCLLRIFSHRFHRFTQKLGCLQGGALVSARLCRLPEQEVHQARSAPTEQNRYSPTESTEPTELLAECILPQIAQIYTELLVECVLPQISQNSQKFLLNGSPTDFTDLHRLFGCLQGGALVSSAPTKQYRYTSCYVGALETSAPPEVSSICVDP